MSEIGPIAGIRQNEIPQCSDVLWLDQCVSLSPWQSAMPVNQVPPTLLSLADEVTA
jgi:hypothetical protein